MYELIRLKAAELLLLERTLQDWANSTCSSAVIALQQHFGPGSRYPMDENGLDC